MPTFNAVPASKRRCAHWDWVSLASSPPKTATQKHQQKGKVDESPHNTKVNIQFVAALCEKTLKPPDRDHHWAHVCTHTEPSSCSKYFLSVWIINLKLRENVQGLVNIFGVQYLNIFKNVFYVGNYLFVSGLMVNTVSLLYTERT